MNRERFDSFAAHHSDSFIAVHVSGISIRSKIRNRSPLPARNQSPCAASPGANSPGLQTKRGRRVLPWLDPVQRRQPAKACRSPTTSKPYAFTGLPKFSIHGRFRHVHYRVVRETGVLRGCGANQRGLGTSRIGVTEHVPSAPELRTKAFSHRRRPIQNLRSRREHIMRPGPLCRGCNLPDDYSIHRPPRHVPGGSGHCRLLSGQRTAAHVCEP